MSITSCTDCRKGNPTWTWAVTAILFLAIVWLSTPPIYETVEEAEARDLTPFELRMASAPGFDEASDIVFGSCSMCHAREPVWDGIARAPKGVLLETRADIARNAEQIFLQAGITDAMPPPNVAFMEPEDRAAIARWYRATQM